jgi:dihydroxyacetone kinase
VTSDSGSPEPSRGLADLLVAVAAALAAERDVLNRLDGVAGDGDLGVTVSLASDAIADVAADIRGMPTPDALGRVGTEIARRAPSTSGTLAAFAFLAAGRIGAVDALDAGARAVPYLEAAALSIKQRGKVAVGDRTMLDALAAGVDAFRSAVERGDTLDVAVLAAATTADGAAAATASMPATVGRAAWLGDRARGNEDAGARLVAMAFEAAAKHVSDQTAPSQRTSR